MFFPLNFSRVQSSNSLRVTFGSSSRVDKASIASLSIVLQSAMRFCNSVSIKLMNRLSGSMVMLSLSSSSTGTKSGRQERASDCTILCPGVCTSLMSNSDK